MLHLFSLFYLFFKRFIRPRNMGIMLGLLIVFLFSMHQGIKEHKKITANVPEFQKIEAINFSVLNSYDSYSNKGFNVLFVPPASGIFFHHPEMLSELSGKVDSIITLSIQSNCKGGLIFRGNSRLKVRFSNVALVLVTLAVLFLGFTRVRPREYLKFLSGIFSRVIVYLSLIFSNLVFFLAAMAVIIGCCLGLCLLEGISLTRTDLTGFAYSLVPLVLMLASFFISGIVLGCLKSKELVIALLILIWIGSVFLLPWAEESKIEDKSFEISSPYQLDNKKLKVTNEFENDTEKKYGKFDKNNIMTEREIIEDYFANIFPRLEKLDSDLKLEISRLTSMYHNMSMWCPTTFYNSVCYELSGRGYLAYLDFYSYLQEMYRGFVRFWIDRVYYHDPKIMVCFIKADENLFHSSSKIPPIYVKGVIINLCWLILFTMVSFFLFFKRCLHGMKKSEIKLIEAGLKKEPLELDKGDFRVLLAQGDELKRFLYNVLTGEIKKLQGSGFCEEMLLDGMNICNVKNKNPVLYISIPGSFSLDFKVIDLIKFIFRLHRVKEPGRTMILENEKIKPHINKWIKQLKVHERFELFYLLLQAHKKKGCVYLIDDTVEILPNSCLLRLKELLEQLKEDAVVIYITQPQVVGIESLKPGECFVDGSVWFEYIKKIKNESEIRNKMKIKQGRNK